VKQARVILLSLGRFVGESGKQRKITERERERRQEKTQRGKITEKEETGLSPDSREAYPSYLPCEGR
jgi:hypothetical protein